MRPIRRSSIAWTVLVAALAADARADESIARRLHALRSLVDSDLAIEAARTASRSTPECPVNSWWRNSQYGARSRAERAIRDASLRFTVDTSLIRAVIQTESAWDPLAVSHKGAQGLMQLMPATAGELGVVCVFDPRENVLGGTRYLRQLRDRLGSWRRALAGYHAGPSRVEAGRIPAETRRYVDLVMRRWRFRYASR